MLPIDIEFGVRTPDIEANSTLSYAQKLCTRLNWAYRVAQEAIQKEQECSEKEV